MKADDVIKVDEIVNGWNDLLDDIIDSDGDEFSEETFAELLKESWQILRQVAEHDAIPVHSNGDELDLPTCLKLYRALVSYQTFRHEVELPIIIDASKHAVEMLLNAIMYVNGPAVVFDFYDDAVCPSGKEQLESGKFFDDFDYCSATRLACYDVNDGDLSDIVEFLQSL